MLPDILLPNVSPLTLAALDLARLFYHSGSLVERSMLFGVRIAGNKDITPSGAEIVVTVAIRPTTGNRRGLVYAGMVE